MEIRKAQKSDLEAMMALYERARSFMAQHGNPTQWGTTDPSREQVCHDIENQNSYLCLHEGDVVGVFYYRWGEDATYAKIYEGEWLNQRPYGVVHRIASSGTVKGVGAFCLDWALNQCGNLRMDTHRDNLVMRSLLEKLGFAQCGTVIVENGTQRIAYQKECPPTGEA